MVPVTTMLAYGRDGSTTWSWPLSVSTAGVNAPRTRVVPTGEARSTAGTLTVLPGTVASSPTTRSREAGRPVNVTGAATVSEPCTAT